MVFIGWLRSHRPRIAPSPDETNRDPRAMLPALLAIAATAAVVAYGNTISSLPGERRADILLWANAGATVAAVSFAAGAGGLRLGDLGLGINTRNILVGIAIGGALSIPVMLFVILAPLITGDTVQAHGIEHLSLADLAWRVGVRVPLGTALVEELLFRGVLFALWLRAAGVHTAVVATAVAFGLWHCVISFDTVSSSGVVSSPAMVGLSYAITLVGLTAGGVFFALLRWRTGSIAAPLVFHWTFNAIAAIAVWARA
jgi:membrane protease YdiL (CAAX protease family)